MLQNFGGQNEVMGRVRKGHCRNTTHKIRFEFGVNIKGLDNPNQFLDNVSCYAVANANLKHTSRQEVGHTLNLVSITGQSVTVDVLTVEVVTGVCLGIVIHKNDYLYPTRGSLSLKELIRCGVKLSKRKYFSKISLANF